MLEITKTQKTHAIVSKMQIRHTATTRPMWRHHAQLSVSSHVLRFQFIRLITQPILPTQLQPVTFCNLQHNTEAIYSSYNHRPTHKHCVHKKQPPFVFQ